MHSSGLMFALNANTCMNVFLSRMLRFYQVISRLMTCYRFNYCSESTILESVLSSSFRPCAGVWKGLVARIIMIGTLTALQWFIYDSVKVYFRLPRPPPPEMPESLKKKLGLTE